MRRNSVVSRKCGHRTAGVAAILCLAVLALAGCGSSKSSAERSKSAESTPAAPASAPAKGPKLTKSPITTMTLTSVNYNGPSYKDMLVTAQLYEKWINAHGGIAGHPLNVLTCDDQGVPSNAEACARQAVSKHATAVVSSFSVNDADVVPILQANHTAWFGTCCALAPIEFKSPVSFPLGNNPATPPGGVYAAVKDKCKDISVPEIDLPSTDALNTLFSNIAKAAGYTKSLRFIKVPATASDITSEITQAAQGSDCVVMYLNESQYEAATGILSQIAPTQKIYGLQGNFDEVSTKGYESYVKDATVFGTYPPLSSPVFANYRAAIAQYKAPTGLAYDSLAGLGTWTAYVAFTNIVKGMTGPINNNTFLSAATKTTHLSTNGILPPINFTKFFGALGGAYKRDFNRNVYFFKNPQKPSPEGSTVDMTNPLQGKPIQ